MGTGEPHQYPPAEAKVQSSLFSANDHAPLTPPGDRCDGEMRPAPGVLDWGWVVAALIESYTPRGAHGTAWLRVAPEVRRIVRLAEPNSVYSVGQLMHAAARLALYADGLGMQPAARLWLTREMIEAFIAGGCPNTAESTRANYRGRLLRLRAVVLGPDLASGAPARLSGSHASRPYGLAERSALWACANAQPTPVLRSGMKTLMALGLGCGLDSPEAVLVHACDVRRPRPGGPVLLHVSGARERSVVCRHRFERVLEHAAAALEPDQFLFRPDAAARGKNTVTNFLSRARLQPDAPRLSMGRARASWIVDLVDERIPLTALVAAAGVESLHALSRLMPYFTPADPALAEQSLRGHG